MRLPACASCRHLTARLLWTSTRCFSGRRYDSFMSGPMSAVTISETRNLVLPLDTVLEALVHFDRKGSGVLMHGEVLQARIMSGSKRGDGIDVALRNSDTPHHRVASLRLLEHHRGHHQLLPREAHSAAVFRREVADARQGRHHLPHREPREPREALRPAAGLCRASRCDTRRVTSRTPSFPPARPKRSSEQQIASHARGH